LGLRDFAEILDRGDVQKSAQRLSPCPPEALRPNPLPAMAPAMTAQGEI